MIYRGGPIRGGGVDAGLSMWRYPQGPRAGGGVSTSGKKFTLLPPKTYRPNINLQGALGIPPSPSTGRASSNSACAAGDNSLNTPNPTLVRSAWNWGVACHE